MPLRDHFRPPLDDVTSWESFHGQWPAMIVMALERKLPRRYVAGPRIRLGAYFEIDVGASEEDETMVQLSPVQSVCVGIGRVLHPAHNTCEARDAPSVAAGRHE